MTSPKGAGGSDSATYRGVWVDGFETAAFFENASRDDLPYLLNESPDGWLSFASGQWPLESGSLNQSGRNYFEISFVGSKEAGDAGHLGQYPAEYVANRVISLERICFNFLELRDASEECTQP